jgi:hypothetical protein
MWKKAGMALQVAAQEKIDTFWYNFYKRPMSMHQRYEFGYWLAFYIYQDLRHQARLEQDASKLKRIDKAYYSGQWEQLLQKKAK